MTALLAFGVGNAAAYTAPSGVCAPAKASYSSHVSMSNSWGAHSLPLHPPTPLTLASIPRERERCSRPCAARTRA
eukprot:scaffold12406_cov56-Phaeocystis_antarctica.AAC.4